MDNNLNIPMYKYINIPKTDIIPPHSWFSNIMLFIHRQESCSVSMSNQLRAAFLINMIDTIHTRSKNVDKMSIRTLTNMLTC